MVKNEMQTGNITTAVWDRSFGHRVLTSEGSRLSRDSFWKDRSGAPSEVTRPVGGQFDLTPEMIIAEAVNRSFLKYVNVHGLPEAGPEDRRIPADTRISVSFLLGRDTTEEMLHDRMDRIVKFCRESEIKITCADAARSDAVLRDVLTVSAWTTFPVTGRIRTSVPDREQEMHVPEGYAVCFAGFTGDAGISVLSAARKEHLKERFSSAFTEHALQYGKKLLCRDLFTDLILQKQQEEQCADAFAGRCQKIRTFPIGEGGVFAALWYFCRLWKTGARIDPRRILIHQETIEICEYLGIHPYQLYTCQAVLFAAPSDEIWPGAVRIGETTGGSACILEHGEEIRYLEKPQPDGLMLMNAGN